MTGFFEGTGGPVEPVAHGLNFHDDVFIADPLNGQILIYNDTTSLWENQNDTAATERFPLGELTDVVITTPLDAQVIAYDNQSLTWVNTTQSGTGASLTLGELTDVTLTNLTTSDRLEFDGGQWVNQDSAQSTANPITIGDGSFGSDATLILNAGNDPDEDAARIEFQNNSVISYRMGTAVDAGNIPQFYIADFQNGEIDPKLVVLIWRNPASPTLNEFSLVDKTQFRIYRDDTLSTSSIEMESMGQGTTDNGMRIYDSATGQGGITMNSSSTVNEITLDRKGTNTPAITLTAANSADNSEITLDGVLNFTAANNSRIEKDGVAKIDFDDSTYIRINGNIWVEEQVQVRNPNVTTEYYRFRCSEVSGVTTGWVDSTATNSGLNLSSRSSGGSQYYLYLNPNGNLYWRGNIIATGTGPAVFGVETFDGAAFRNLLEGIVAALGATPAQQTVVDSLITAAGL